LRIDYETTLERLKKEDWITCEKLMIYEFKENYKKIVRIIKGYFLKNCGLKHLGHCKIQFIGAN
jgi:hypothetical protein